MNAYKLNGIVGHLLRRAICKKLQIHHTDIYKVVSDAYTTSEESIIETKEGKKYKITLKQI